VSVVNIFAGPMNVVAIVYALVGCRGVAFFLVILVGGTGCIGAYLVRPVWSWYGTVHTPASGAAPAPAAAPLLTWLTVAGPSVTPFSAVMAVMALGGVVPVIPVMLNLLE